MVKRRRSKKMNSAHKLVCPKDLAPQMQVEIGQVVKGSVAYVNSPMNFAVRPTSYEANLKTIGELCAALPDDRPPIDSVLVGTILGAIYSEDGIWYRSLIQSVNVAQNVATVYFIDYGNTDTVKIEEGLRWLTHDLTQFPPQILECQWIYAPSTNTSEASTRLNTLTDSREITMTIVGIIIHSDEPEERLDIGGEHGTVVVKIKELEKGKFFFGRTLPTLYEVEDEGSDSDWSESSIEDDETNNVDGSSGIKTIAEKNVGKTPEERIEAIIKEAVLRHIGPVSDDSLPIASTSREVQAADSFEALVVPSVVNALASAFECYLPFGANTELPEIDDSNLAILRLLSLEAKLSGYESENQHALEKFTSYIQFTIHLASEIMKIKAEVARLNAIAQIRPERQTAIYSDKIIRTAVRTELLACKASIGGEIDEAKRVCGAEIEDLKAWVESTAEAEFEDIKNFVEVERHSQRKEVTRLWNQMKADFDNTVAESKRPEEGCQNCATSLPSEEPQSFASVEDELKRCRLQLQAAHAKTRYFTDCFEQMDKQRAKDRSERDEERVNFRAAMEIKEAELQALRKRWSSVMGNERWVKGPKPK